jgi:membrane-associated phospholipid phosphatase
LLGTIWFVVVYGLCNWVTAHRSLRIPIHLPIELSIPFVPAAVLAYMSIYLLFLAGPFIVRERQAFSKLIRSLFLAILIGGIGFLLFPSELAYAPPSDLGRWAALYHLADRLNLDYNLAPSLHVALAVCCVTVFAGRASVRMAVVLWAWAAAIALSTLLTHQHHVVDVITGWALGGGVTHCKVWRRRANP